MNESFDLLDPTNFVAGTVGDPGERIFFIQGADATDLVSLKLEKVRFRGWPAAWPSSSNVSKPTKHRRRHRC